MHTNTWTRAAVVAGLLGAGLPGGDAAAQAPDARAARLRKETDNLALQKLAPFKVFDNLYYVGLGYASRTPGAPHPFVAPDVFRAWIAELKTTAAARLAEAKAKEGASPAGRP